MSVSLNKNIFSVRSGPVSGAALTAAVIQASVKLSDLEEMYKTRFGYQLVPEKFGKNSLGELLSKFCSKVLRKTETIFKKGIPFFV